MKASRIHRFGPPEVIELDDVERPEPGDDEVLVRVKAAGVGPWDALIRAGKSVLPQPLPLTLGSDLSGVVTAVGKGTRGVEVGSEVFGVTNERFVGAYAEYAVASASMIARKPRTVSHREAAAMPVVSVTALQMLFDHGHLASGQRVLVHGAGGSVGAFAVQLARAAGAHVIGTARGSSVELARKLGAQQVVDTNEARFEQVVEPVDLVLDTLGGELQSRSFGVLKRGGTMISAVSKPNPEEAARRGVRADFMLVAVTSAALARIAVSIDRGELAATRIGTVLSLGDARIAHEMLEGTRPHDPGKILLSIAE
jgi:NADPH:quinone reductase-like Zn-dependent oxidoreductase